MIEITEERIDPVKFQQLISPEGSGSMVIHYGVVKGFVDGKSTSGLRFEVSGDLEAELRNLEAEIQRRWQIRDFALIRRMGELKIGDLILAVGVSAEGRKDAFGACADAVDCCKKLSCIKKTEMFAENC